MSIKSFVALLFFSPICLALSWDSPTAPFSTQENVHENMIISWKPVDDVQKICEVEYKSRGFGHINYKVDVSVVVFVICVSLRAIFSLRLSLWGSGEVP